MTNFDLSNEHFPIKNEYIFLAHCGISAQYAGADAAAARFQRFHTERAALVFREYPDVLGDLRNAAGRLLRTDGSNVAFVKNTAEGLSMIANGYPFEPGDRIVSYVHEYPSNHYPWKIQERRGAELVLLPDSAPEDTKPRGFTYADVARILEDDRVRVLAVSHVQFTSGYAADLKRLGALCKERGVDFIVDAAQSLGGLPLFPEEHGISAIAASGWKWLMGPIGTGLLYTSPELRAKIAPTMAGPELMLQGDDYLDHTFAPHTDARRFEYSTGSLALSVGLHACINDLHNRFGIEAIHARLLELQERMLAKLDRERFRFVEWPAENRSGILACTVHDASGKEEDPNACVRRALDAGVFVSSRGGYLRLAPHFPNSDDEIDRACEIMNGL